MAPRKIPTRPEPRDSAAQYLRKAEEFLRAALDSLTARRWNAAALAAVHAAIAGADAVLVFRTGRRGASQRHEDVVDLLAARGPTDASTLTHLRRILGKKNLVEYESRLFLQREAQELVQHAERFLGWARTQITPSPAR